MFYMNIMILTYIYIIYMYYVYIHHFIFPDF